MKLLPIAIKSGALAKLLNTHIIIDQVLASKVTTVEFPDNKLTIRPLVWKQDRKAIRLTYKDTHQVKYSGGTYDSIGKWHTDIVFKDNRWRMAPALATGLLDFETYSNYVGTTQYLSELIRSIGDNKQPSTFQQWKERFLNA